MRIVFIFCIITAGIISCHANLGDTMDQCVARYGKPMTAGLIDPPRLGGVATVFQKDGYNFQVYLINGAVECETISKSDRSPFTDEERGRIIQMESAQGTWAKPVAARGQLIWMGADGSAISSYPTNTPLIVAMSKKYLELASEAKKKPSPFPSEAEVRTYVVTGMSEEDVIKHFGNPYLRTPSGTDGEDLMYLAPLPPKKVEVTYGYNGFQISVSKGKVTDFSIIHETVKISK